MPVSIDSLNSFPGGHIEVLNERIVIPKNFWFYVLKVVFFLPG